MPTRMPNWVARGHTSMMVARSDVPLATTSGEVVALRCWRATCARKCGRSTQQVRGVVMKTLLLMVAHRLMLRAATYDVTARQRQLYSTYVLPRISLHCPSR